MKVLKYVLAVIFILGGFWGIDSDNYISGFSSILLGSILIPKISSILRNKYKRFNRKRNRYSNYAALIIMIVLFSQQSGVMDNTSINPQNKFAESQQKRIKEEQHIKDSLDIILKKINLSVCKVYTAINSIELQAIKDADKKYPNFGDQHFKYSEKLRIKRTNNYIKEKGISELLVDKAIVYSTVCWEKERLKRVEEAIQQKKERKYRKEKIQKCYENTCNELGYKIKKNLNSPKSFEYVDCKYLGANGSNFTVLYRYRATNSLNALILSEVKVIINSDNCNIVEVIE
ncbi:hypothetical protein [uncultured Polaribacter sp.]|uniref:hypothetical protein n=1 Tax=uncultured Polaribacter sp. TaxID=174711 RepID=UPI002616F127|nr:hypothetical protein [uncultured Polaribacter sp.]